ncbi:alpha/beta fold hydrolase [Streptomyces triticagri]|uniref:Alpha/beta fold hydrolase n=1 Tax=Streptomyces triticagri TaxID=2293568 RepID=A0A372M517_9ACTN|nr:alpha/beta fold hydrolase [Streptomyces triticagri]
MRDAEVTPEGDRMRWVELPGREPTRVYVHGLGASSPAYFTEVAADPGLAGHRSLLIDLLGHGLSDRPEHFDYSLPSHADALAEALTSAGVAGAELIAHSMGGSVAVVLAARHPHLVSRLVLVDANLDAAAPAPGAVGSSGIAAYSEQEFLSGGWAEFRDRAGEHWWSTLRLTDRRALYRSAVHLARGTVPTLRELLTDLSIPRTYLLPEDDGPLPGAAALTEAGVHVVAVPDCGHNIMLDNPRAFVAAAAAALDRPVPVPVPTPRARRILEAADRKAAGMGHSYLGVEHLMLAVLDDPDSVPTQVMAGLIEPEAVSAAILEVMESPGYNTPSTRTVLRPE